METREPTRMQVVHLEKAIAMTKEQFSVAREIARDELQLDPQTVDDEILIQIVKILALNVQSVALRPISS